MSQPYVGEIRMFGGNFAPVGWAFCDGQPVAIAENDTLFNLIGTTYGGDGQTTFNLPDLRGRAPLHMNSNFIIGEAAGTETVTVTIQQLPLHSHLFLASDSQGASADPTGQTIAKTATGSDVYVAIQDDISLMPGGTLSLSGGSQPHENMQPFLVVSYIISLYGIYPSQT